MSVYTNVSDRYAKGAQAREESLCCPVDYDRSLLAMLPSEIIEKDYGCGDPSRYVREGDTVLDLGSGGGKICYMAAQLVGDAGRVIGVDMTDDMLALARKYQGEMAQKLGGSRVEFKKAYIQNLAMDVEKTDAFLASSPVKDSNTLREFEDWKLKQSKENPLIETSGIDLVISNCVLNLVAEQDRKQMISEIFRVLKPSGRVAISDIVADEYVPEHLKNDATLWSGCISGAFQEKEFLQAFIDAGFVGARYDKWDAEPWQVVEGIEFRSVTLTAMKPSQADIYDGDHAVLYKGPYAKVYDDLGNVYLRGERMAVSRRTHDLMMDDYYAGDFIGLDPAEPRNHGGFCKPQGTLRSALETKGGRHSLGQGGSGGDPGACC